MKAHLQKTVSILFSALLLAVCGPVFAGTEIASFDGSVHTAGPVAPVPPPAVDSSRKSLGLDATAEYYAAFNDAAAVSRTKLAVELKRYKVLFIPGLFSNVDKSKLPLVGIFCSSTTKPRYEEHMALLKELGVDHERLALQTESSVEENGARIAQVIKASDKPVILMGSSKAGLDMLAGLIGDPAAQRKVRGVIMLQAPFFGTPVANALIDEGSDDSFLGKILRSLGGSIDCLVDLTTWRTKKYMADNAGAIALFTGAVPVISVATWVDKAPKGQQDTGMKAMRNFMLRKGLKNDGLVPVDSAILPGSDYVKLSGADHGATAQPTKLDFDRVGMTKAVLTMIMAR